MLENDQTQAGRQTDRQTCKILPWPGRSSPSDAEEKSTSTTTITVRNNAPNERTNGRTLVLVGRRRRLFDAWPLLHCFLSVCEWMSEWVSVCPATKRKAKKKKRRRRRRACARPTVVSRCLIWTSCSDMSISLSLLLSLSLSPSLTSWASTFFLLTEHWPASLLVSSSYCCCSSGEEEEVTLGVNQRATAADNGEDFVRLAWSQSNGSIQKPFEVKWKQNKCSWRWRRSNWPNRTRRNNTARRLTDDNHRLRSRHVSFRSIDRASWIESKTRRCSRDGHAKQFLFKLRKKWKKCSAVLLFDQSMPRWNWD